MEWENNEHASVVRLKKRREKKLFAPIKRSGFLFLSFLHCNNCFTKVFFPPLFYNFPVFLWILVICVAHYYSLVCMLLFSSVFSVPAPISSHSLIGHSKLALAEEMRVPVVVCHFMWVLWLTGNLSGTYPASCLVTARMGTRPLVTLLDKWFRNWMDGRMDGFVQGRNNISCNTDRLYMCYI